MAKRATTSNRQRARNNLVKPEPISPPARQDPKEEPLQKALPLYLPLPRSRHPGKRRGSSSGVSAFQCETRRRGNFQGVSNGHPFCSPKWNGPLRRESAASPVPVECSRDFTSLSGGIFASTRPMQAARRGRLENDRGIVSSPRI